MGLVLLDRNHVENQLDKHRPRLQHASASRQPSLEAFGHLCCRMQPSHADNLTFREVTDSWDLSCSLLCLQSHPTGPTGGGNKQQPPEG